MNSRHPLTAVRFLQPGELFFLVRPTLVSTVLGSCVAVTLFYPPLSLGCICHAVFPEGKGLMGLKYVDQAVLRMVSYFDRRAIPRLDLEAKLFGGASQFGEGGHNVGAKNVSAALLALEQAGLRLAVSDVGGAQGRKLLFNSQSGEVFLKRFRNRRLCP